MSRTKGSKNKPKVKLTEGQKMYNESQKEKAEEEKPIIV